MCKGPQCIQTLFVQQAKLGKCLFGDIFRQPFEYLAGKGDHLKAARFALRDAAAAHVEEFVGVQAAESGAVAALDIVGVDFQLRQALRTAAVG